MPDIQNTAISDSSKTDVAVNIFAKPFQTALSLLSLINHSKSHIGTIWLQFEPVGSKHDPIPAYFIAKYITDVLHLECQISQPDYWLDLNPPDENRLDEKSYRFGIRYQYAFENSPAEFLFLMHNDVFIFKDILGALIKNIGDYFAIGQLGQCWNCPAANFELMNEVMQSSACTPDNHLQIKPTKAQLQSLYRLAQEKGIFVRPYDVSDQSEFSVQPWPLPECRINEWACLLNLKLARSLCRPTGNGYPPGAYRQCGPLTLDIGVPWFRHMYANGFQAKHFDISTYLKHWVGTGNNTAIKYAYSEDRALNLLKKYYPGYMTWLKEITGKTF